MLTDTETLFIPAKTDQSVLAATQQVYPDVYVSLVCSGTKIWIGATTDESSFDGNYYTFHETTGGFELHEAN